MPVKQSTLGNLIAESKKEEAATNNPVEATTTEVVAPVEQTQTVTSPIEEKKVETPVIAIEPKNGAVQTEVKPEEQISKFSIPSFETQQNTLTENKPQETTVAKPSWKDILKDVNPDEIAEYLGYDEFTRGVHKHIKNGGDVSDYLNAKGINWDKVSDADILKGELRKEHPEATNAQIDRLFNKKYNQTDIAEEEDKEDGALMIKSDARKLRSLKIAEQQKFKTPEAIQPQQQNSVNEEEAKAIERNNQFVKYLIDHDTTKSLFQSKRVAIDLGEGQRHNVELENPQILTDIILKPEVFAQFGRTPQGEPDVQQLLELALFRANPIQFKKDLINVGKKLSEQKMVEEGQNIGKPATNVPDVVQTGFQVKGQGTLGNWRKTG